MKTKRMTSNNLISILLVVLVLVILIISLSILRNPEVKVVKEFYKYEQKREFWNSYELFHPQMKEQFTKDNYVQQRDHIFVNHFGVSTFDLKIGKSKKLSEWKMSENHELLSPVYKIPVTQTYNSTFGIFAIQQDVYVTREDNEWRLLWSYHFEQ